MSKLPDTHAVIFRAPYSEMNGETALLLRDPPPPSITPPHLLPSTQKHAQPRLQRHAHKRRLRHTSSFPSITHKHDDTHTQRHKRVWEHRRLRRTTCKAAGGTALLREDHDRCGCGGWSCTSRRTGCRFTMSTASDRLSDETVRPRIHFDHSHISKLRRTRSLAITPPRPGLNPLAFFFFFSPSNDVTPGSKALGQPQRMDGRPCRSTKIKGVLKCVRARIW